MQRTTGAYDVGVLVGRFQVPDLHDGHRDLIQTVLDDHDKVILFLGLSPLKASLNNPLDFESRKQMVLDEFPEINVLYVNDVHDDDLWSRTLDAQIKALIGPKQSVVMYGSRDSFIDHYTGAHPTALLEQETYFSGTEVRKDVARKSTRQSPDFRAGVVWATHQRFAVAFPTVDVAIFNEDGTKILLGRKPNEKAFRLPGGFVDPGRDKSFESAARRETAEELGIEITDPKYVASVEIDDWRYRGEDDKIITTLFQTTFMFGRVTPGDDIIEAKWVEFDDIDDGYVVPEHEPLIKTLREKRNA